MSWPKWWAVVRIAMAAGTVVALRAQFAKVDDDPELDVAGFFSLFTNESNILAVIVLLTGAIYAFREQAFPGWWDDLRGALVAWLALTGVVFVALLAEPDLRFTYNIGEPSDHLHKLMPLFLLLDWLLFPPRKRLSMRSALWWTVPPILFCIYSLLRGPYADWYPYDFLDPNEQGGYLGVMLYVVGIAVGFLLFSAIVVWLGNRVGQRDVPAEAVQPA